MDINESIRIFVEGRGLYLILDDEDLKILYCNHREKVLQLVGNCAEKNFIETIALKALHIFASEGYEKANEYIDSSNIGHEPRLMLKKGSFYDHLMIGTWEHCYELAHIDMNSQGPIPNLAKQLPECPYRGFDICVCIFGDQKIQRILSMDTEEITLLHKFCMVLEKLPVTTTRDNAERAFVKLLEKPKETFLKEAQAMIDQAVKKMQIREKARKRREENCDRIDKSIKGKGYYRTPHGYLLPRFQFQKGIYDVYFFADDGFVYVYSEYERVQRNKLYTLNRGKTPKNSTPIKPPDDKLKELGKIDSSLAVKIKLVSSGSQ